MVMNALVTASNIEQTNYGPEKPVAHPISSVVKTGRNVTTRIPHGGPLTRVQEAPLLLSFMQQISCYMKTEGRGEVDTVIPDLIN